MFSSARLRLTVLYGVLLGVAILAVATANTLNAIQETRRRDDQELRLRAQTLSSHFATGDPEQAREAHEAGERLEGQGLLSFVMPIRDGMVQRDAAAGAGGLPDVAAAQRAAGSHAPRFDTFEAPDADIRVYSLPVTDGAGGSAVVQVARSLYFSEASIRRLILTTLAIGGLALVAATAIAYWLAGRTLRPIARALERQQAFAADASHELRTPLSVVLGNAELLARHPDEQIGTYADVVDDIVTESRRLTRLVSDLLTLARSDSGQIPMAGDDVDLAEVGATLVRQFEPLAQRKHLRLSAAIDGRVHVRGDAHWLHELGVILLDNAVRYTERGEIRLQIACEGGDGCLEVSDTGRGIAPEHLSRLTERFYRANPAQLDEDGGTGLGLAIADWIVRAHHGRLSISSRPGEGSTFTVHLPGFA